MEFTWGKGNLTGINDFGTLLLDAFHIVTDTFQEFLAGFELQC